MDDWPILPGRSTIRSAVEASLAPLGFRRRGGSLFQRETILQREITKDLIVQVMPNGNEVSQQIYLSVVSLPVNRIALEVWEEVGRTWAFGRKELAAGVPIRQTWLRGGWVGDSSHGRQERWHFFSMPEWGYATVTLDEFCRDLRRHSEQLVRETPDLEAALSNPRFGVPRHYDLEAAAYAFLGKRLAFESVVVEALEYFVEVDRLSKETQADVSRGPLLFVIGGPGIDIEKYFGGLRRRFFGS